MNGFKYVFLLALIVPGCCWAVSFQVDTTSDLLDQTPGDGSCRTGVRGQECSLRAAVQEANALGSEDVIHVPAGTYVLTRVGEDDVAAVGDLDLVNGDLTITGAGAELTIIDGNDTDRIFDVGTRRFVLQNVTVQNGLAVAPTSFKGGGISVVASVGSKAILLQGVRLRDNWGNSGGAVYADNTSDLTIENSLIENNFASGVFTNRDGPAIFCNGCQLHVQSSTIRANDTVSPLGAIRVKGGNFEIVNTTIGGNVGGGIMGENANGIVKFSTIINNGEPNLGHHSFNGSHVFQIGNSVIQNADSDNCTIRSALKPTSLGYNVTSDNTCAFTAVGDLQGTPAALGALQDNGGMTPTHRPTDGSVVIDRVPIVICTDAQDSPLTEDQRGASRPVGSLCDVGSVEWTDDSIFLDGFEN